MKVEAVCVCLYILRQICWVRQTYGRSEICPGICWRLSDACSREMKPWNNLHRKRIVKSPASVFTHWHRHKDSLYGSMMETPGSFSFSLGALIELQNWIAEAVPASQCGSFTQLFNELCREIEQIETSQRKKGLGLLTWLTHSRGMLNKRPCLIQISNGFSTAAPPTAASSHKNEALWGSVHFLWMRCSTLCLCSLPLSLSLFSLFLALSRFHTLPSLLYTYCKWVNRCWRENDGRR